MTHAITQRKLTEVGVTILGLYFFIVGIEQSDLAFRIISPKGIFSLHMMPFYLIQLTPTFVSFIVAIGLITYSTKISSHLFSTEEVLEIPQEISNIEWLTLAFCITGIFLLVVDVLPGLLSLTFTMLFPLDLQEPDTQFTFFKSTKNIFELQISHYLGTLFKAGVGIYLIFRANGLAEFVTKIQSR